jgi:hypothetical protein
MRITARFSGACKACGGRINLPYWFAAILVGACAMGKHVPPVSPRCERTETPSTDTTVYPTDSLDFRPRPEWIVPAGWEVHTAAARGPAVEGRLVIETDGRVQERTIRFQHVDDASMVEMAKGILTTGRSCPAIRHGVPVRSTVLFKVIQIAQRMP